MKVIEDLTKKGGKKPPPTGKIIITYQRYKSSAKWSVDGNSNLLLRSKEYEVDGKKVKVVRQDKLQDTLSAPN
jgi:hypothetical protein